MGVQQNSLISQIKSITDKYETVDIDKAYVRKETLGELNFGDIKHEIQIVLTFFKKIASAKLESFPPERLKSVYNRIKQLDDQLSSINQLSVSSGDPSRNREGMIINFRNGFSAFLPEAIEVITFDEFTTGDKNTVDYIQQMQEAQDDVAAQATEFKKLIEQHTQTANQIVEKFGMQKYAKVFSDESKSFKVSARYWLIFSFVTLIITIGGGLGLLYWGEDFSGNSQLIQFTITKIVILTACFFGVNICFKNYRAQKHNEILNKHRHNALVTFEAFTAGKEDEQTKNAVLLAATQTIFGNQQTGYGNPDSSDSDMPTRIIEIMKATPQK